MDHIEQCVCQALESAGITEDKFFRAQIEDTDLPDPEPAVYALLVQAKFDSQLSKVIKSSKDAEEYILDQLDEWMKLNFQEGM